MKNKENKEKFDVCRMHATIKDVFIGKEDHGIKTVRIDVVYDDNSAQSFGNLNLGQHARQYANDICDTFNVALLKDLIGKKCYALFCFGTLNELMEGLESVDTKMRFTNTAWRMKMFGKSNVETPLEVERKKVEQSIAHYKTLINKNKAKLKILDEMYRSWL